MLLHLGAEYWLQIDGSMARERMRQLHRLSLAVVEYRSILTERALFFLVSSRQKSLGEVKNQQTIPEEPMKAMTETERERLTCIRH